MRLKEKLRAGLNCNNKGYFDSYRDNIFGNEMNNDFQEMFDNGSGGELHSKAEAVHSSSMLSYNMLHWINQENPFILEDITYYKVYFEVKMRTLSCKSNPANMDVVLEGKNDNGTRHLLFIESKFLEYTKKSKSELSHSYEDSKNWYNKNIGWNAIIQHAKEITQKSSGYSEGIKQTITHLFGINGLVNKTSLDWFNKSKNNVLKIDNLENITIEYANFIYEPNKKNFPKEHCAYENYKQLYDSFVSKLPLNIIKPRWYSYTDVWNIMKGQINNEELISFIEERYMQFAKK